MTDKKVEDHLTRQTIFVPEPVWVPVSKWVRIRLGNEYVASSRRVMLKREFPMVYFFPQGDVNMELLEQGSQDSQPDKWGKSTSWHIKTKSKKAERAAWSYKNPGEKAPEKIEKYMAFQWDAMDMWLEEDEEVRVHPRDPYHRLDVCKSSRHVQILINGKTVADTHCPVLLFETGLPVRFYIPKTDVQLDLLQPTHYQTQCPYKGTAFYYSIINGGDNLKNVIWTYPFPNTEVFKIKDLVAFFTEKLEEVFIDGKKLPKVKSKWAD